MKDTEWNLIDEMLLIALKALDYIDGEFNFDSLSKALDILEEEDEI